jgi:hypothetical protein
MLASKSSSGNSVYGYFTNDNTSITYDAVNGGVVKSLGAVYANSTIDLLQLIQTKQDSITSVSSVSVASITADTAYITTAYISTANVDTLSTTAAQIYVTKPLSSNSGILTTGDIEGATLYGAVLDAGEHNVRVTTLLGGSNTSRNDIELKPGFNGTVVADNYATISVGGNITKTLCLNNNVEITGDLTVGDINCSGDIYCDQNINALALNVDSLISASSISAVSITATGSLNSDLDLIVLGSATVGSLETEGNVHCASLTVDTLVSIPSLEVVGDTICADLYCDELITPKIKSTTTLPIYLNSTKTLEILSSQTVSYNNLLLKGFSSSQGVNYSNPKVAMGVYDALLGNPYIQLNSQADGDSYLYFTDTSSSLGYIKYNHTFDILDSYMLFTVNTLPRLYLKQTEADFTDLDITTTGNSIAAIGSFTNVACSQLDVSTVNVSGDIKVFNTNALIVSRMTPSDTTIREYQIYCDNSPVNSLNIDFMSSTTAVQILNANGTDFNVLSSTLNCTNLTCTGTLTAPTLSYTNLTLSGYLQSSTINVSTTNPIISLVGTATGYGALDFKNGATLEGRIAYYNNNDEMTFWTNNATDNTLTLSNGLADFQDSDITTLADISCAILTAPLFYGDKLRATNIASCLEVEGGSNFGINCASNSGFGCKRPLESGAITNSGFFIGGVGNGYGCTSSNAAPAIGFFNFTDRDTVAYMGRLDYDTSAHLMSMYCNTALQLTISQTTADFQNNDITTTGKICIGAAATNSAFEIRAGAIENTPTYNGIQMGFVSSVNPFMQLSADTTNYSGIDFTTAGTDLKGRIVYYNNTNTMTFWSSASDNTMSLSAGSVNCQDSNIVTTGNISCTNVSASGTLTYTNLTLTGDISCVNMTATGTLTYTNLGLTGDITSVVNVNASGDISGNLNSTRGQLLTIMGEETGTIGVGSYNFSYGSGVVSTARMGQLYPCNVKLKKFVYSSSAGSGTAFTTSTVIVFRLYVDGTAEDVYAYCDFSDTTHGLIASKRFCNKFSSSATSQVDTEPSYTNTAGVSLAWITHSLAGYNTDNLRHRFGVTVETLEDL